MKKSLRIGNSHTAREIRLAGEPTTYTYRTYPGGSLMRNADLYKVSRDLREIKKENYEHLIVQFGGNEAYDECKKPKYENHIMYNSRRIIQNLHRAQRGVWDPQDPCNTFFYYEGALKQSLETFVGEFLRRIDGCVQILGVREITIIAPGPRWLKSPSDNGIYNTVCYYLSHQLKLGAKSFWDNHHVQVLDPFLMQWGLNLADTDSLKIIHNPKEVRQTLECTSKYGATHYTNDIYLRINRELSLFGIE